MESSVACSLPQGLIFLSPRTAQCNGQSDLTAWGDVQVVWYKCDSLYGWHYICGDSGWGDEEATVVCREHGYSHGTGGE